MADISELLGGVPGYIFGGTTGLTLDQIRRRQDAAALKAIQGAGSAYPKTLGEGLTALGRGVGSMIQQNRLDQAERDAIAGMRADPLYSAPRNTVVPGVPGGAVAAPPVAFPGGVVPTPAPRPASAPGGAAGGVGGRLGPFGGRTDASDPVTLASGGDTPDRTPIYDAVYRQQFAATPEVGQENPTQSAAISPPSQPQPGGPDGVQLVRRQAIGGMESGGQKDPYRAIGPPTKYGTALGKYQVLDSNVPQWTKAALGQSLTPDQFLASPEAQDAVFDYQFGKYVKQFGEEGAAQAWFGGPGRVGQVDLKDKNGTSIGAYGQEYVNRISGGQPLSPNGSPQKIRVASLTPSGTMSDAPPINVLGTGSTEVPAENEETPTDIQPAPVQLAQAGGTPSFTTPTPPPGVPKPTAPAVPVKPIPAEPSVPTPRQFSAPPVEPTPPQPAPADPNELRADALRKAYPLNADAKAVADDLERFGKEQRGKADALAKDLYDKQMLRYQTEYGAWQAQERERDKLATEQKNREADLEIKLRNYAETQRRGGLTAEQSQQPAAESFKKVDELSSAMANLRRAQELVQQGLVFNGFFGQPKRFIQRMRAEFGDSDPRIAGTEEFITAMAPIVAQLRKNIVGTTQVSNFDLATTLESAARDLGFSPQGMLNTFANTEAAFQRQAMAHNKTLATIGATSPEAQRDVYGKFGLPMEDIVPRDSGQKIMNNLNSPDPNVRARAMSDFDERYNQPGLAQKILDRMRR